MGGGRDVRWRWGGVVYQERFNERLYEPSRFVWAHRHLPERVRMWSPWWVRHVVAVERRSHQRTMDELRERENDQEPPTPWPSDPLDAVWNRLCWLAADAEIPEDQRGKIEEAAHALGSLLDRTEQEKARVSLLVAHLRRADRVSLKLSKEEQQ